MGFYLLRRGGRGRVVELGGSLRSSKAELAGCRCEVEAHQMRGESRGQTFEWEWDDVGVRARGWGLTE